MFVQHNWPKLQIPFNKNLVFHPRCNLSSDSFAGNGLGELGLDMTRKGGTGSKQKHPFQTGKISNFIWQAGKVSCVFKIKVFEVEQFSNGRRKGLDV